MADLKIGIVGCAGRMGRALITEVTATPNAALAGGTEASGSGALGRDLGELAGFEPCGVCATEDAAALFAGADAVIDFTAPAASAAHAALAAANNCAFVVGTTGLKVDQQAAIEAAAKEVAVVQAANMSLGVNLLMQLTAQAAAILDPAYDIEVFEIHHRHKVDAPSGTALALGRAAAEARGVDLDKAAVRGRDGHTGARDPGTIGFTSLRGGDVVGDHSVIFAADGERIELTHKATSRTIYARGAVRAALWTKGRGPGLYAMADGLGL